MAAGNSTTRRSFLRTAGVALSATALVGWRDELPLPPDDGSITAFTLIHGIPGKEDELKQHLVSLSAPTRAEPGCIKYDLYQSPKQRHEFLRFEVWASMAALEAHKQTPHLRASFEKRQREGWTTEIVLWERVS